MRECSTSSSMCKILRVHCVCDSHNVGEWLVLGDTRVNVQRPAHPELVPRHYGEDTCTGTWCTEYARVHVHMYALLLVGRHTCIHVGEKSCTGM